jgi:hypothetical protein
LLFPHQTSGNGFQRRTFFFYFFWVHKISLCISYNNSGLSFANVKVKVLLKLTVSKYSAGAQHQLLSLLKKCGFVDAEHPLLREARSVLYNPYWASSFGDEFPTKASLCPRWQYIFIRKREFVFVRKCFIK